jgi:type VI secretion system secreted protein VgrG
MALSSGKHLQLAASEHLFANSGGNMDVGTGENFTVASGKAISLFANAGEMKLFASREKIEIQAQKSTLQLAAYKDLDVSSSNGEIRISAKKSIVLACGGGYLKIHPSGEVELGSPLKVKIKAPLYSDDPASLDVPLPDIKNDYNLRLDAYSLFAHHVPMLDVVEYEAMLPDGEMISGSLDKHGRTERLSSADPGEFEVVIYGDKDWDEAHDRDDDDGEEYDDDGETDSDFDEMKGA